MVSAGVVAFLQRSDASLLKRSAGGASEEGEPPGMRALRPLWLGLGVLMVLTPLGILAAGSAWGEWVAADFHDPAARQQMAAASLQQQPPPGAPQGIERLGTVWTAPFARYAPPYIRSAAFGYMLSAMFGVGIIVLLALGAARFARSQLPEETPAE